MASPEAKTGAASATELIIPVTGSLYAVYYIVSVWNFPFQAQLSGVVLAGLFLFFALLFFLRTFGQIVTNRFDWRMAGLLGPTQEHRARAGFLVLVFGYLYLVPWGGFTLTTFVFLLVGSYLSGLRPWSKALIFAAVGAIGGWVFFILILGTRFPQGPFEQLVTVVQSWI